MRMSLTQYNREYEKIMGLDISEDIRAERLAELMTNMEREFGVSVFRFYEWAQKEENKKIAALYQKISRSRDL